MSDASQTKEFPLDPASPGLAIIVRPSPTMPCAIIELKEPSGTGEEKITHVRNVQINEAHLADLAQRTLADLVEKTLGEIKVYLSADPAAGQYPQDDREIQIKMQTAVKNILYDKKRAVKTASAQTASKTIPHGSSNSGYVTANNHPHPQGYAGRPGNLLSASAVNTLTPEQTRLGVQIEDALMNITGTQQEELYALCSKSGLVTTAPAGESPMEHAVQIAIDRAAKNWGEKPRPTSDSAFKAVSAELLKSIYAAPSHAADGKGQTR